MTTFSLTKRAIEAAGPGRHYDDKLTGFGLYVGRGGARSYFLEYRPGRGRSVAKRRISIGAHGAPWTPHTARDKALELLAMVKAGRDPLAERQSLAGATTRTVAAAVEEWLARDQANNRSRAEVERVMRHDVLPAWGRRPLAEIRKSDVLALVESIADRGSPIMANRTLAHVKRLFRWAAGRDLIEADPAAHVEKPAPETRRDRVLSDTELVSIWRACDELGFPFGPVVQVLALTGARREEVLALRWSEVDFDSAAIHLAAGRVKSGQARIIPLALMAENILRGLPRLTEGDCVFSLDGRRPFANIGRAKARLDRVIAGASGSPPVPWRLHDLRRTVATGLQRLGVRLEVTETVLGHVSGSRAGVVGIYQRHHFQDEARAALVAWADHLARLGGAVGGAEVVPFARRS
jgi:integrase